MVFKNNFFFLKKLFQKFEFYYFIFFTKKLNFDFGNIDISIFPFFIAIFYLLLFGPMYSSGWLLFYSLKFATCNNIWDIDEILAMYFNANFICWFYLYSFHELFFFCINYYYWLYLFWLAPFVFFYPDFFIISNLLV